MDVALEMNGAAEISPRRQINRSAASFGRGIDGFINRRAVEIFSVAHGSIIADVVKRKLWKGSVAAPLARPLGGVWN